MVFPTRQPDSPGEPPAWIPLDEAAQSLQLSKQSLWHRLQDLRIQIVRIERDGRRISALARDDLRRLAASENVEASVCEPIETPQVESPAPAALAAPAFATPEPPQPSLWQQLRELETQRNQLDFELRVVRVQLADTRARIEQSEESLRLARGELEHARAQAQTLRERLEPLRDEHLRDATVIEQERERRASVERQLAALIEIEEARERYCDRLEQRFASLRQLAKGA